jgi:hypothetical protein
VRDEFSSDEDNHAHAGETDIARHARGLGRLMDQRDYKDDYAEPFTSYAEGSRQQTQGLTRQIEG